ncbi:MAG: ThuA domain-containing protein [Thermoguttaceae bacterium]
MKKQLLSAFFVIFVSTITASVFAAEKQYSEFKGEPNKPGSGKTVVLVSGDEEYRSEEILNQLGKILAKNHGFDCFVLYSIDPKTGEIDPCTLNNIPELELLEQADVAVFFLRFRDLPDEQMRYIDEYLKSGKPVLGIRTSTHAFNIPEGKKYSHYSWGYNDKGGPWEQGFGRLVLGETWINHHGEHGKEATRGVVAPDKEKSKLVNGCEDVFGPTDVYTVRLPLPEGCENVMLGEVLEGMNPTDKPVTGPKNDPKMPIAWTKPYKIPNGKQGIAYTSTMGCGKDFHSEGFRRLLVNATYWLAGLESQIPEKANVEIIGEYDPPPMGFAGFKKGMKP